MISHWHNAETTHFVCVCAAGKLPFWIALHVLLYTSPLDMSLVVFAVTRCCRLKTL